MSKVDRIQYVLLFMAIGFVFGVLYGVSVGQDQGFDKGKDYVCNSPQVPFRQVQLPACAEKLAK